VAATRIAKRKKNHKRGKRLLREAWEEERVTAAQRQGTSDSIPFGEKGGGSEKKTALERSTHTYKEKNRKT